MANEKRQRQDRLRAEKQARQGVQKAKDRTARQRRTIATLAAVVVLGLGLIVVLNRGGSSSSDTTVAGGSGAKASASSTTVDTTPRTISKELSSKPEITIPAGKPPTSLQITDLVVGTGTEVTKGSTAIVQYVGKSWSDKKEFDSSWSRGAEPFAVEGVPNAPVIPGWNEGLLGMRKGGRRMLVIPPDKGYGAAGTGPIGPNETLVFIIDLIDVR